MAKYLGLVKVSPTEASRILLDGPLERRGFIEHIVHEAGGKVEGYWLTNVGDWDLVCVVDMGEGTAADGAAATIARRAAGLAERERWIELVDVEDVVRALVELGGPGAT